MARKSAVAERETELSEEIKDFKAVVDRVWDSEDYKKRREDMNRWWKQYQGFLYKEQELSEEEREEIPESQVVANFIFSNIQAIVPLLTDNKPKWGMRAKRSYYQPLVNLLDRAADYFWDTQLLDEKVYKVVQDCMLFHLGLMKPYWDSTNKEIGLDVEDPRTFVCSPGYEDLWDVAWCGFKKLMPLSYYASKFPEKFEAGLIKADDDTGQDIERDDNAIFTEGGKTATLYEFWVRDERVMKLETTKEVERDGKIVNEKVSKTVRRFPNGRILMFTKDCELGDYASPFAHGKPPLVAFYDYRVPHSIWGMGEPCQIETLVLEFNRVLRALVLRAHLTDDPNYLFQSGCGVDPEEFKNTYRKGGQVYTINAGVSAQDVITVVPVGQFSQPNQELLQILPMIIQEINGVVDITKGIPNKKQRQSASEITSLMESAYTRMRQKVRNLEWSLLRLLYLVVELMQQFYTDVRDISMQGEGDERYWVQFSMDSTVVKNLSLPPRDPEEPEEAYKKRITEDRDYNDLIKALDKQPSAHAAIDYVIDTNSTLPMDKQSLANLMLRLAEIRNTPDSIVDDVAVLETLNIPNREKILERKATMREQIAAMRQAPPQGDLNGQIPQ